MPKRSSTGEVLSGPSRTKFRTKNKGISLPWSVEEWTRSDVQTWLSSVHYMKFAENFKTVDGQTLSSLTNPTALFNLGVTDPEDQKGIQEVIDELSSTNASGQAMPFGTSHESGRMICTSSLPWFVEEWTRSDVQAWLRSINCERFAESFKEINGQTLLSLRGTAIIKNFGVTELKDQETIQRAIDELSGTKAPGEAMPSGPAPGSRRMVRTVSLPWNVETWTREHVQEWLASIGYAMYADNFKEVDGKTLLSLRETTMLSNFGVTELEDQSIVREAVNELSNSATAGSRGMICTISLPLSVDEWTRSDVQSWLSSINYTKFAENFKTVDGQTLRSLTETTVLSDYGVTDPEDQKGIQEVIDELSGLATACSRGMIRAISLPWNVSEWKRSDVQAWLSSVDYTKFAENFKTVDGQTLSSLTNSTALSNLGVTDPEDQKGIREVIDELSSTNASGQAMPFGTSPESGRMVCTTSLPWFVEEWTRSDVQAWFFSINYAHVAESFIEINGQTLLSLRGTAVIKDLGVTELKDQEAIRDAIEKLSDADKAIRTENTTALDDKIISDGTIVLPGYVQSWTNQNIKDWLTSIGYGDYIGHFETIKNVSKLRDLLRFTPHFLNPTGMTSEDQAQLHRDVEELSDITLKFEVMTLVKKLREILPGTQPKVLEGCWLPGKKRVGHGVYCRREYHELYNVIESENGESVFSIEGVPGIGKTMMIPFVVWKLLHSETPPANIILSLQTATNHHFVIHPATGSVSLVEFNRHEVGPGHWFLHDGTATDEIRTVAQWSSIRKAKTLVFICPRRGNRLKSILPEVISRRVMSPFDEDELLDIHKEVYSRLVGKNAVLKSFDKIGGVPRYVFEYPKQIGEILHWMESVLSANDILNDTGEIKGNSIGSREEKVTLKAVQPWWGGDAGHKFLLAVPRFASPQIATIITENWDKDQWQQLVRGAFLPGKEKGSLFEIACHNLIPQARASQPGVTFENAQRLEYNHERACWNRTQEKQEITLPTCTVKDIKGRCLTGLLDVLKRLKNYKAVYGKPISKIFKTVDSVVLTNNGKDPEHKMGEARVNPRANEAAMNRKGDGGPENPMEGQADSTRKFLVNPLIFVQYTTADIHSLLMDAINTLWKQVCHRYVSEKGEKGSFVYPVFYFIVPSYRRQFMPSPPKFSQDPTMRKEEVALFEKMSFFIIEVSREMLLGQIPSQFEHRGAEATTVEDSLKDKLTAGDRQSWKVTTHNKIKLTLKRDELLALAEKDGLLQEAPTRRKPNKDALVELLKENFATADDEAETKHQDADDDD